MALLSYPSPGRICHESCLMLCPPCVSPRQTGRTPSPAGARSDPPAQILLILLQSAGNDNCLPPECFLTITVVLRCSVLCSVPNNWQNDLLISFHGVASPSSPRSGFISKARLITILVGAIKLVLRSPFFSHTFIPVKAFHWTRL